MSPLRWILMGALLLGACESTPKNEDENDDGLVDGTTITIPASDMEPVAEFIHRTRRLLVAEYIRVELIALFYEGQLGLSRDLEYV